MGRRTTVLPSIWTLPTASTRSTTLISQRLTEHVADGAVWQLDQILAAGGCRRGRLWWRRERRHMTVPPSDRIEPSAFRPGRWLVSLNRQLRQSRRAYLFAENAPHAFAAMDEHAKRCIGRLLERLAGVPAGNSTPLTPSPPPAWVLDVGGRGVRLVTLAASPRITPGGCSAAAWQSLNGKRPPFREL